MVEKIGHIKNPLTVIAIFAGIAEISGTVVLPFVASEIQSTYIWFLMGFPFFLVGVFFYTLHKKPTALYSPSDYKDENNFVTSVRNASPAELSLKLRQEVREVQADIAKQEPETTTSDSDNDDTIPAHPTSSPPVPPLQPAEETITDEEIANPAESLKHKEMVWRHGRKSIHYRVLGDLALAEKLAVSRLSKSLRLAFQHNVQVDVPGERGVTFDAFAIGRDIVHAVEVKFFATSTIDMNRLGEAVHAAKRAADALRARGSDTLLLHLFIVSEASETVLARVRQEIMDYASKTGVFINVHTATMTDLANEYQYG